MEDFLDNLTGYFSSDPDTWPVISYEIDRVWIGRAEPDVGIMDRYVDDYTFTGWVGEKQYRRVESFANAICEALGELEDETIDVLADVTKLVEDTLNEEAEYHLD